MLKLPLPLDLGGQRILAYPLNVKASGSLKGDGEENVSSLLTSLEERALADGEETELEFPVGRYKFSTSFVSSLHVTYKAQRGAVFVIPSGVTVVLDSVEAGPWKCFEIEDGGVLVLHKAPNLCPQWFGAVGDNSHDDTAAVQKALDVLSMPSVRTGAYASGPSKLRFWSGVYKITDTLTLTRGVGVTLEGISTLSTKLSWAGAADKPMILLYNARAVTMENLFVAGNPASPPSYLIEVRGDKNDPALWLAPGRCRFKRLVVGGSSPNSAKVGIAYTYAVGTGPSPPNNDQGRFEDVEISNVSDSEVQFGTEELNSANAKSFRFDNCVFTDGRFGIRTYHASYYWNGGYIGQHQPQDDEDTDGGVDFWFYKAPSDTVRIDDADSEGSARFLVVGYPSWLGQSMPMIVTCNRVSTDGLADDGILIHTTTPGPLFFSGNRFGEIGRKIPVMKHEFQTGDVGTRGGYVVYEGNAFDALDLVSGDGSYDHDSVISSGPGTVVMRGNTYRKMGPAPNHDWLVMTKTEERVPGVQSISGDPTLQANNLRGTFDVTGNNSSATVNFPVAEPDANYFITITPVSTGAGAAVGSSRIKSVAKLAASFTVTLEAAPGGTATNSFDWHLIR